MTRVVAASTRAQLGRLLHSTRSSQTTTLTPTVAQAEEAAAAFNAEPTPIEAVAFVAQEAVGIVVGRD